MKYEQPELNFLSEEDKKDFEEQEAKTNFEKAKKEHVKDDGLSFDCEICQDSPGGCPSCGWGSKREVF